MAYIYNITFFCEPAQADEVLAYLRKEFLSSALAEGDASFLHITRVLGSKAMQPDEAASFGMQFSLPGREALECWRDSSLAGAFRTLESRFADRVLHIDTLLEVL